MSLAAPSLRGRVSRRDVALSPHVWFALWGTFALFAISTTVITFVMPGIDQTRMLILSAALAVASIALARMKPPEPGSTATHSVLALVYIGPALAIWAFAPGGSAAVASATFIGPLTSVWLVERRQIAAHLAAASVIIFIPSLLGGQSPATLFACIALVPAIWVLAGCCVLVMESAETQGSELERLVGRDPLTGLGNRRTLDDQLTHELARHAATRRQLTVLALDLNGFKRLNDTLGHAAGDELLTHVAAALTASARRHDLVVRQGGDEFCLLLPGTTAAQAEERVAVIRDALARIAGFGSGVTSGIGAATFPADGATEDGLLRAADDRLRADKLAQADPGGRSRRPTPIGLAAEHAAHADDRAASGPRVSPSPPTGPLDGHVSREDLSLNRGVWQLTGAMYLIFSLIGVALGTWEPQLTGPAFPYAVAFGASIGVFTLLTPPPAVGTLGSHASIAATYVVPVLALVTCQPGGSVAIGSSIFVGALTAMRATDRRIIARHLSTASVLFLAPIPLGLVDPTTTVAILMLLVTMWVLGLCCTIVFEAIEAQGEELAALVRRDPLTGVGNRRLLHERLAHELPLHTTLGRQLTLLALDLNGFKTLNDTVGHAAGDRLLTCVADRLSTVAGARATVIRQGGDEFCILLPDTDWHRAQPTISAIRGALGTIDVDGVTLTTGIGSATFPGDATDADALLERADDHLRRDKYAGPAAEADLGREQALSA